MDGNKDKKQLHNLKGEVGMVVQKKYRNKDSRNNRYILHPYFFSSSDISMKRSRDVICTLFFLLL